MTNADDCEKHSPPIYVVRRLLASLQLEHQPNPSPDDPSAENLERCPGADVEEAGIATAKGYHHGILELDTCIPHHEAGVASEMPAKGFKTPSGVQQRRCSP